MVSVQHHTSDSWLRNAGGLRCRFASLRRLSLCFRSIGLLTLVSFCCDCPFRPFLPQAPLHCLGEVRVVRDGDTYEPRMPPVVYQPMSMLINAFKTEHVHRPLPGFGVLVPSNEQRIGGIRSIGEGKIMNHNDDDHIIID